MPESLYDIPLTSLDGRALTLAEFRGQVLLLVNVASQCGLTPQYAGLASLDRQYRDRGLRVLGFPCNDFAGQEPGSAEEIQDFCSRNYGVDFPMFSKLNINTPPRHPLYSHLIAARSEAVFPAASDFREKLAGYGLSPKQPSDVLWNFEKFLVDRHGNVINRFSPDTSPDDPALIAAIEAALA